MVLCLTAFVTVVSLVGALAAARRSTESLSEQQALAIARSASADPRFASWVLAGPPSPTGPAQAAAEVLRARTQALYVVVTDDDGIRYSHPNPALVGQRVSTDPSVPLSGGEVVGIERGTLGLSARGKVPLRSASGQVIGSVSVGIAISAVNALQRRLAVVLLSVGLAAFAISALIIGLQTRRLRRMTHGLELDEMADLLLEHAAVFGGALAGVVGVDQSGRIRLANQAARDYLGTPIPTGVGVREAGLPPAVAELLSPDAVAPDAGRLLVLGERVLVARRVDVRRLGRDIGAVVTLTDRTDLDDLGRELEATRALTDALRAQAHEYTNRLHALSGMLHLGDADAARAYLDELSGATGHGDGLADPYLRGILAAKGAVASEQGVELRVTDQTWVEGRLASPLDAVTVLGNLIDNALRAASGGVRRPAWVEVTVLSDGPDLVFHVVDSGDGVAEADADDVFAQGWTTKPGDRASHGIGLALARVTARRHGGDVELLQRSGEDHGAAFGGRLAGVLRRPGAEGARGAGALGSPASPGSAEEPGEPGER